LQTREAVLDVVIQTPEQGVWVFDHEQGEYVQLGRIVVDSGAEKNCMSEETAQRLGCSIVPAEGGLRGIDGKSAAVVGTVVDFPTVFNQGGLTEMTVRSDYLVVKGGGNIYDILMGKEPVATMAGAISYRAESGKPANRLEYLQGFNEGLTSGRVGYVRLRSEVPKGGRAAMAAVCVALGGYAHQSQLHPELQSPGAPPSAPHAAAPLCTMGAAQPAASLSPHSPCESNQHAAGHNGTKRAKPSKGKGKRPRKGGRRKVQAAQQRRRVPPAQQPRAAISTRSQRPAQV